MTKNSAFTDEFLAQHAPFAQATAQEKRDKADEIASRFGCEFQTTSEPGVVALMVLPRAQGQHTSPIEACVAELTRYGVLPERLVTG